jgi:osmotically-inducible protein OsmY
MFKGDKMSTDQFLRKKIINSFKLHTEVDSSRVHVNVNEGIVVLTGKVDGPVARATLEAFVMMNEEVQGVINQLKLDSENLSGVQGIHIS